MVKNKDGSIETRISKIIEAYNGTFHEGLKCTPEEAWNNQEKVLVENSKEGIYKASF